MPVEVDVESIWLLKKNEMSDINGLEICDHRTASIMWKKSVLFLSCFGFIVVVLFHSLNLYDFS